MRNPVLKYSYLRSITWRLGRRLYTLARRDSGNDPRSNGEYWLIDTVLQSKSGNRPMALVDVGANTGEWTAYSAHALLHAKLAGFIHAFEPAGLTFSYLKDRFKLEKMINLNHLALSDITGEADFYIVGELAGTNSLHFADSHQTEPVRLATLDAYMQEHNLAHVDMVKCDTEGHDLCVLRGAETAMREGKIDVWQFEYNHRWIANRAFLKDVFDWVADKPYRLGKLFNGGIELFDVWHPELERFFEANYVLVRRSSALEALCQNVRFNASNALAPVA